MTSSFLPDINVWVALHHEAHRHHASATQWFHSISEREALVFCRHTQVGMFRLLSTDAVMYGAPLTQRQCWKIYMQWIEARRAILQAEPAGIDTVFQRLTSVETPSPRLWANAYLAAFARTAGLTLVTLDRVLAGRVSGALLLG